ncbi:peptidyl-tRNA hydrolase, chloroplastic [Tanacetum coccineum]
MCPCPHSALCAETSACDLDERQTGIGRPPGKMEAASYVLRRFSKQESEELDFTFQTGIEAVRILLLQGFDKSATFIFISNEDLDAIRVQSTRGKKRNDSMNIVNPKMLKWLKLQAQTFALVGKPHSIFAPEGKPSP